MKYYKHRILPESMRYCNVEIQWHDEGWRNRKVHMSIEMAMALPLGIFLYLSPVIFGRGDGPDICQNYLSIPKKKHT